MRKGLIAILAGCVIACGDSTGPEARTLRLGRYAFTGYGGEITGTLTLTFASSDSIAGTWSVNNFRGQFYDPPATFGLWNSDAYALWAHGTQATALTYTHRIWRNGESIGCTGKIAFGPSFGCTLVYQGP